MPFDLETGAPEHPSINLNLIKKQKGSLLLQGDELFEENVVEATPWTNQGEFLEPLTVKKIKRNGENQPASRIGFFALNPSLPNTPMYERYLGSGAFGKVKFCQHKNKSWYVAKIIPKPNFCILDDLSVEEIKVEKEARYNSWIQQVKKEAYFLHKLSRLAGFYMRETPKGIIFYLIQEWIDGTTLSSQKENLLNLNLGNRICEFYKFLSAIDVLHENRILHCDLKPANIIKNINGDYVIIDFGQSQNLTDENKICDLVSLFVENGTGILECFFCENEILVIKEELQKYITNITNGTLAEEATKIDMRTFLGSNLKEILGATFSSITL